MEVKQILKNSVWFGIIPKLTTVINLVLLPLITPYLTRFDYGIIGVVTSYSSLVGLIAILGLNIHLTNSYYVYGTNFRLVWGRILGMLLYSGTLCALGYGFFLVFALTDISGWIKGVAIVGSCIPIALTANVTLAQHYYTLRYNPRPLVLRNLAASLCGILVTFVCIYYLRWGFIGWIMGTAVSAIAGFVLFISPLWRVERIWPNLVLSRERVVKWLKVSLPIVPHSLGFVLLSSSSKILMDWFGIPMDDIGLYSNGYIMGDYAVVITSAMVVAVAPRIQELYRAGQFVGLRRLYLFCQAVALMVSFVLALWMPEIYRLFIHNEQLQPASEVAVFICFANAAFPFYSFISTAAFIEEKTRKILWLVFIPAVLNIVLNVIFLPMYGYKAAIFTTLIAYWSQLMIPYVIGYFKRSAVNIFGSLVFPVLLLGVLVLAVVLAVWGSGWLLGTKVLFTAGIVGVGVWVVWRQRNF